MKIIYTKRAEGKTTKLIQMSAESGYYIVCHPKTVEHVMRQAHKLDLKIPNPLNYDEFINKRYRGTGIKGLLVDDVDLLVQHMSSIQVHAITLSEEEEKESFNP